MRREIPIVAVLVLVIAGIGTYSYTHQTKKTDPCIAGPTEQCPTAEVRESWADFIARRKAYQAHFKQYDDERKLLEGWAGELDRETPPGFKMNQDTLKYEKNVVPLPPQATEQKK
jgi:hypothetical protein